MFGYVLERLFPGCEVAEQCGEQSPFFDFDAFMQGRFVVFWQHGNGVLYQYFTGVYPFVDDEYTDTAFGGSGGERVTDGVCSRVEGQ